MIGDLICTACAGPDVVSVQAGQDAEYWPGRGLDAQDVGVTPILLRPATRDIAWCLKCWIAKFRTNASASPLTPQDRPHAD